MDGSTGTDSSSQETDSTQATDDLPLDQVYDTLKNSRRRQVLQYLHEGTGEASLGDLAEEIAAIENDTSVDAVTTDQRKRTYVGLYQCHLPKMADAEIVDFEKNRGTVKLGPKADQLEPYLGQTRDLSWYRLYSWVTAAAVGVFAASVLGPVPLTPSMILIALLAVMSISSAVHIYVES